MTEHTRGLWMVTHHQRASLADPSIVIEAENGRRICDLPDYPDEEDEANAYLIAAAPFLFDVLMDLVSLYAALPGHDPFFVEKGLSAIREARRRRATAPRPKPGVSAPPSL